MLAFLSDRDEDGTFGIYLMHRDGGEAVRLAGIEGAISDLKWSPDGGRLAYLRTDPDTPEEKARQEAGDDVLELEQRPKYQRLWVVEVDASATGDIPATPRQVSGDVQVWEYSWTPDGQGFALVCSELPYEWSWYSCYLATQLLAGGELREVYRPPKGQLATPEYSPDGASLAFIGGVWSDRGVVGGDVYVLPLQGGEAQYLTSGYPASFGSARWLDAGTLLAIGYEEGEGALVRLRPGQAPETLWRGEALFADRFQPRFSWSHDKSTLAVVREDPGAPPDVWTVNLAGEEDVRWERRTLAQPELGEFQSGDAETLRWTSPDGTDVQGILLKPAGYREGERVPLVTVVHGGPTAQYHQGFITSYLWAPLLVSRGCAVLLPNPRGSTGWGREFAEANLGDMGGGDLQDILSGVDFLVERGLADPKRLGICGWSYGGYMVAWAVTQTERFRAAVMGAGIANWRSFHGVSNIPAWDRLYMAGNPYEEGGAYDRFSPILNVRRVRTPTLVLHGERDECVPVGQGYEWYRALRECGVEARLVVYPREGHGPVEKPHLKHMLESAVEWLVAKLTPEQ
jgi:dipeptidyl aminopeptidase/acylaminoacyl peptidase